MKTLYIEDLSEGFVIAPTRKHLVTEDEIIRMGKEWDPQPFHIDKKAAQASFFGGLVASTVHLYGIANILANTGEEKLESVSGLGMTDMINHKPAYVGDELDVRSTCLSVREAQSKPDLGVVKFKCELFNQNNDVIFSFVSSALSKKRP